MTKLITLLTVFALFLSGCATTSNAIITSTATSESAIVDVDDNGYTNVNPTALNQVLQTSPAGTLTQAETDGLLFMHEEEKLAHDVYVTLGKTWNVNVFQNIPKSEQTHTDAVKTLLDRYGLADPASSEIGVFKNADLQKLYDQLIADGSGSLASALKVGALIEDMDIVDLEARIAQTDKADIILVYQNLTKGSRNHLRAFVKTLKNQTGEDYTPQYLSQEAYDAIINSDMERGGGQGNGGNGQGNGNGGNGNNNGRGNGNGKGNK
ncbi:MAG: DUF2202 domain-containing protein [Herpetosiphon sp.]|nr:DUF2202 domain-containing protein [Herpetosiphon sp.]